MKAVKIPYAHPAFWFTFRRDNFACSPIAALKNIKPYIFLFLAYLLNMSSAKCIRFEFTITCGICPYLQKSESVQAYLWKLRPVMTSKHAFEYFLVIIVNQDVVLLRFVDLKWPKKCNLKMDQLDIHFPILEFENEDHKWPLQTHSIVS